MVTSSKPKRSEDSPTKISFISMLPNLLTVCLILTAILFVSAGRWDWLQAWLFVLAFTGFLAFYGLWGVRNDPGQLNERRQVGKNTKSWDKVILTTYTLLLIGMLVLAGLDAGRFRWAPAPLVLQGLGWSGAVFAGFLVWWTASVNTFLSRTVRIQDERRQHVIDSGPYSRVRHPMYLGVIILMISIPLLLGSLWALIPGAMIGVLFIIRTALEDHTLQHELPAYQEYTRFIRYRLLPWIW
jgi:protein-S-isoprenylcysteine O-methyltransferase Ste14